MIDCEKNRLRALFYEPSVLKYITPDEFYSFEARRVFMAMVSVYEQTGKLDLTDLARKLVGFCTLLVDILMPASRPTQ